MSGPESPASVPSTGEPEPAHAGPARSGAAGVAAAEAAGCGPVCPARRVVLTALGATGLAVVLAGCQTYGAESSAPVATRPPGGGASPAGSGAAPDGAAPDGGASADGAAGGEVLASLADIPVGGGVVFADKGVVVTCPREGTVKAFSVTCPHAGCAVNEVAGGTINCPCHGSKFKVEDGSVAAGPARKPLSAVPVTLDGDSITLT